MSVRVNPQQSIIIFSSLANTKKQINHVSERHAYPPTTLGVKHLEWIAMSPAFISHSVDVKCHRSYVMHAFSSFSNVPVPSTIPTNLSSSNNMD